jgi:hypothetical protein
MERYPAINGIQVDLDAVSQLAHDCQPALCSAASSCCSAYEITISESEMPALVGSMAVASKYATHLSPSDNILEEVDNRRLALETNEDGLCLFAYRNSNTMLCSLHSAALEMGLPPHKVKPTSCSLWPLALCEGKPPLLTVQDDAYDFPCNKKNKGNGLHSGVVEIIQSILGESFLTQLTEILQQRDI